MTIHPFGYTVVQSGIKGGGSAGVAIILNRRSTQAWEATKTGPIRLERQGRWLEIKRH